MTSFHLDFEKISDLLDGDLPKETTESYISHIAVCSECKVEYERMSKCLSLLVELRNQEFQLPDMCSSTLELCEKRRRKQLLMKRIPAVAASCFILFGVAYSLRGELAKTPTEQVASRKLLSKTEKIISHLRNYNATILKMTDKYIDGQIMPSQLNQLKQELAKGNVHMEVLNGPYYRVSKRSNNYEDVSLGNQNSNIRKISPKNDGKLIIRILK